MRITTASTIVLSGATALVSGLTLPRATAPLFSSDSFKAIPIHKVPLEEAKAKVAESNEKASHGDLSSTWMKPRANGCNPGIRPEWTSAAMTPFQGQFISAIQCLIGKPSTGNYTGATNRFEDLASVHQQMVNEIHMDQLFLPWHRLFLLIFEMSLRNECQYTGPMPWWDMTKDAGNFINAEIFTDATFSPAAPVNSDGSGTCITTGSFANLVAHIGPGGGDGAHCVSRAVDESDTAQVSSDYINTCAGNTVYSSYEQCIEFGPHAYAHDGIGSVEADVAGSPSDPIFYMIHAFVDRAWNAWQYADTANRLYQINGNATQSGDTPITLNTVIDTMGLWPDATVNDVMDVQGGYLCYTYDY